jgi:hypothetical protein
MSEIHLVLTPSERDLLVRVLGAELKGKRVEVHRTEFSREFRRQLEDEEVQIRGLLNKLSQQVETA